jgi:Uma2 family endonuclease
MSISAPIQDFPSQVSRESLASKKFPGRVKSLSNSALLDALFNEDLTNEADPPLESDWHVASMVLLLEIMEEFFKNRTDVYISGNTAVRFDPNRKKNRNFRCPDFYVIKNVPKGFRDAWVTWEENAFTPDFVIELASTSTVHVDLGLKKEIYEQMLKTPEYVIYNPLTKELLGWRLTRSNHYQAIKPNEKGWLWCEEMGLWLGVIEHDFPRAANPVKTPRFFDENGQLLPTRSEAQAQRAVIAEKRAEAEVEARQKAEAEIARLQAIINASK